MTERQTPDGAAAAPEVTRREFLRSTSVDLGLAALPRRDAAGEPAGSSAEGIATTRVRGGLLLPQRNQVRDLVHLSGLWQFQPDPKEEGEASRWFDRLS